MTAQTTELDHLSNELWKNSTAGFLATTLSTTADDLAGTVDRLGRWIQRGKFPGAIPLGLHLEGPFINPESAGAHPPGVLRKLTIQELESLWKRSHGTLKVLTVASETLASPERQALLKWARAHGVYFSLGHSRATEAQAREAFDQGFRGVTHAFNAMSFHHREPGILGAALGRDDVYVELIPDLVHVAPTLMGWVLQLHGAERTCMVSDCVPAAATHTPGRKYAFGPLTIELKDDACRLPNGALAGGGKLLTESFTHWLAHYGDSELRKYVGCVTQAPLWALGFNAKTLPKGLKDLRIEWIPGKSGVWAPRPA